MSADAIWVSEDFLNERGGLHRGVVEGGLIVLSGGWQPFVFTIDELIASTFVERLSTGGFWIGSSSVLINRRCLDIS